MCRRNFAWVVQLVALGYGIVAPPAGGAAFAQLPTATGRQFTLSNSAWKLFIPTSYKHRSDNVADLLVHFHGDPQTVWNNALYADLNALIVTVNYGGLSSAYSGPFANPALFQSLLDEALTKARGQRDFAASLEWDQLGVSSFSAGYGAVREILKSSSYRDSIDALLAADSLYATTSFDGTPLDSQMVNYKTFASLAQAGEKTFLFSHSDVLTFTYENTKETGDELMQHLGVSPSRTTADGLGTLDFYRHAKSGNFELWGAEGADGDSHLEHLRYIGEFFADLPLAKSSVKLGDFNSDEIVNGLDFLAWQRDTSLGNLADWEADYGANAALSVLAVVPEPASFVLVAAALVCTSTSLISRANRE